MSTCLPASTSSLQSPAASALSYSNFTSFIMPSCSADLHSVNYTHYGVPKTQYTILPSSATASCVLRQFCIGSASVLHQSASVLHQFCIRSASVLHQSASVLHQFCIGLNLTTTNHVPLLPDIACISLSLLRHFYV